MTLDVELILHYLRHVCRIVRSLWEGTFMFNGNFSQNINFMPTQPLPCHVSVFFRWTPCASLFVKVSWLASTWKKKRRAADSKSKANNGQASRKLVDILAPTVPPTPPLCLSTPPMPLWSSLLFFPLLLTCWCHLCLVLDGKIQAPC